MWSEVTIKDVWPKLCELGIIELRINNRTVWAENALDVFCTREDYTELIKNYLKLAEDDLLSERYEDFRVTSIKIKVVDFHHCIADIFGYYDDDDEWETGVWNDNDWDDDWDDDDFDWADDFDPEENE